MTETGATAVDAMVKARFDAASFPRITGPPEHRPMEKLVRAIATVAAGFKTSRYGGTVCLALVVDQEEIQQVARDDMMDCSRANEPQLLNPNIGDNTTTTDEKILTA